ncbi:hypothetical protein DL765_000608 [Monosporascus sp. GIB2]|nr:hypothetical protein DL765_000608 [Monosporascus sp. GIB2]
MPFVFWNISDVNVRTFKELQPSLWAVNIMNGTRMNFNNTLVNATSHSAPPNTIRTGNTDGFGESLMSALERYLHRSNGVSIGSLGQYLADRPVGDVVFDGVSVTRGSQNLRDSAYIKTWMGEPVSQDWYESGGVPRSGSWGLVRNVTFRDFRLPGPNHGPMITQNAGNNGMGFEGTRKMEVRDVLFENWTGFLAGETRIGHVRLLSRPPLFGHRGSQRKPADLELRHSR